MFILRKITSDGLENNVYLGESYQYVNREIHKEEFARCYKVVFDIEDAEKMHKEHKSTCYGIISYNEGKKLITLSTNDLNYIMSSNGQTFANLTHS